MTHRVVLDTDIGSDVDDALALAVLLGSPEVDLVGVTTVYGDTALRARLAARLARLAGREVVAVAGQREPLSGRDVWWAGHEGGSFDDLGDEPISAGDGVDFLVDTVRSAPGEIDLVAIGPLTNVAAAVRADPRFAGALRHLYVMGGRFGHAPDGGPGPRTAEHNFRSDATAAHLVHAAGIRSTTTGLDVTTTVRLGRAAVDRIGAAGALGAALRAEIQRWWRFTGEQGNVPHDPVTVLTMLVPGLFEFARGTVSVDADDGSSTFTAGAGRARVATAVDAGTAATTMIDRIVTAGR
ncbi:nucleoside hydrolase [Actinocatenispora sera]|uniref:Nucleoside hydrolase n=1 Tax=Actinocatenispora sera TaxID=390989 RepID=A0A810L4T2_9ACTN|nr:nucleoside hydrolase [Actinocatenispora sera]BCJ29895.1 nucleoside hydrolase [Actinocatenispora sera]